MQGVGAALLTPGSLTILAASFVAADRARAIGAWSGLSGVAVAAGPLVGGYLISAASWRWIFFINVPIAAAVVALGTRHVPESRDPNVTGAIDYAGALAAVVFLTGITFAFIEAPVLGGGDRAYLCFEDEPGQTLRPPAPGPGAAAPPSPWCPGRAPGGYRRRG